MKPGEENDTLLLEDEKHGVQKLGNLGVDEKADPKPGRAVKIPVKAHIDTQRACLHTVNLMEADSERSWALNNVGSEHKGGLLWAVKICCE